jgi:copper chaperone NosL
MMRHLLFIALVSGLLAAGSVSGAEIKARPPAATDKCAVCGMFVAKFPNFAAQIHFKDGKVFYFDGSKDLFTFYHNLTKYAPGRKSTDIAQLVVTGYYDLRPLDATSAWFVAGSNVNGPMGSELIPFAKEASAYSFAKDHAGKRVLRFKEITPAVFKGLP